MRPTFTDQAIFDGLRAGNAHTTNAIICFLYEQSQKSVTWLVTRNNGTETDAEDLFQEVIVAFLKNVLHGTYQPGEAKLTTYLYSIAQTMWHKELGRRKTRNARHERYGQVYYDRPDTGNPEQVFVADEEISTAWDVFRRLSGTCQQLLTAFYDQKMTMKQIAEQFDLGTEDNAKTRKYRCVVALKKLMTPHEQTNR